jgi:hypothetical protein
VRDDLHVAVPHAPEVVEEQDVPVDEAHGPGAGKERPGKRDPHRQGQDQALQRRAVRSCMHIRNGKKTRSTLVGLDGDAGRFRPSLQYVSHSGAAG